MKLLPPLFSHIMFIKADTSLVFFQKKKKDSFQMYCICFYINIL